MGTIGVGKRRTHLWLGLSLAGEFPGFRLWLSVLQVLNHLGQEIL